MEGNLCQGRVTKQEGKEVKEERKERERRHRKKTEKETHMNGTAGAGAWSSVLR